MVPTQLSRQITELNSIAEDLAALERRAASVTSADARQLLRDTRPIFDRTSILQRPFIDLRPLQSGEEVRLVPEGFAEIYVPSHAFRARAPEVADLCHQALGWKARR